MPSPHDRPTSVPPLALGRKLSAAESLPPAGVRTPRDSSSRIDRVRTPRDLVSRMKSGDAMREALTDPEPRHVTPRDLQANQHPSTPTTTPRPRSIEGGCSPVGLARSQSAGPGSMLWSSSQADEHPSTPTMTPRLRSIHGGYSRTGDGSPAGLARSKSAGPDIMLWSSSHTEQHPLTPTATPRPRSIEGGCSRAGSYSPAGLTRSQSAGPGSMLRDDAEQQPTTRTRPSRPRPIEVDFSSPGDCVPARLTRSKSAGPCSMLSARSHDTATTPLHASPSPRASPGGQDHLGSTSAPLPTEAQAQKVRLRGSGEAIGERAKSSSGIPYRQLPTYSRNGLMLETGDLHQDSAPRERHHKAATQFSRLLHSSEAVKGSLTTTNDKSLAEALAAQDAWLEAIRGSPRKHFRAGHSASCTGLLAGTASDLKDTCPFHRDDSAPDLRECRPAVPSPRKRRQNFATPIGHPLANMPPSGCPSTHTVARERDNRCNFRDPIGVVKAELHAERDWVHTHRPSGAARMNSAEFKLAFNRLATAAGENGSCCSGSSVCSPRGSSPRWTARTLGSARTTAGTWTPGSAPWTPGSCRGGGGVDVVHKSGAAAESTTKRDAARAVVSHNGGGGTRSAVTARKPKKTEASSASVKGPSETEIEAYRNKSMQQLKNAIHSKAVAATGRRGFAAEEKVRLHRKPSTSRRRSP
eukprot:gnl/TRDRNA2_/TRDRNA2_165498_c0_seq2.p1 gnl/TRDRNA2_/TRDRNA2_165498_c0~~gnl/TRDRNA2_/TRDRNA2_165498_c0_seq2.p1  ORF type:complete len:695 (-),score=48.48 gnl/TRDRNA2_/TRDRNA2_165498_c0_seq2:61-2145(-)